MAKRKPPATTTNIPADLTALIADLTAYAAFAESRGLDGSGIRCACRETVAAFTAGDKAGMVSMAATLGRMQMGKNLGPPAVAHIMRPVKRKETIRTSPRGMAAQAAVAKEEYQDVKAKSPTASHSDILHAVAEKMKRSTRTIERYLAFEASDTMS